MTIEDRFALSLYLVFGQFVLLVILAAGGVIALVAARTAINMLRRTRRDRRARIQARAERVGPDGRPLPPWARGLCPACGSVQEVVYFLPDGRRLCRDCYADTATPPARPGAGPEETHRHARA